MVWEHHELRLPHVDERPRMRNFPPRPYDGLDTFFSPTQTQDGLDTHHKMPWFPGLEFLSMETDALPALPAMRAWRQLTDRHG